VHGKFLAFFASEHIKGGDSHSAVVKIMRRKKTIKTTLGELVMAVTEEVRAWIGDSPRTDLVVSYVVTDVLRRYRIREPDMSKYRAFKHH
jgi:hypothetical protein